MKLLENVPRVKIEIQEMLQFQGNKGLKDDFGRVFIRYDHCRHPRLSLWLIIFLHSDLKLHCIFFLSLSVFSFTFEILIYMMSKLLLL